MNENKNLITKIQQIEKDAETQLRKMSNETQRFYEFVSGRINDLISNPNIGVILDLSLKEIYTLKTNHRLMQGSLKEIQRQISGIKRNYNKTYKPFLEKYKEEEKK